MAQAKSNIAVSNDCTSGVFTPNVVVSLGGSALSSGAVRMSSLRVTLNRNEEPDSAEFIINRDAGVDPSAGETVGIALGDVANYLFAGQIAQVARVRQQVNDDPDFAVTCVDWSRLFNRRLVTADFSGQSATDIATAIVEDYTSGFFPYAIEPGLATVDEFVCINERPLSALARLAMALGGGCSIDANKIVHLWDDSGPSISYAPSPPATLTNSLNTLKRFVPEYDFSQIRTRVICEGTSTPQVQVRIPAGTDSDLFATLGLPQDLAIGVFSNGGVPGADLARIGTMVLQYAATRQFHGPDYVVLAADANPGDTTVSVLNYDHADFIIGPGWFTPDWQNFFYATTFDSGQPPYELQGIPASGYGAIQVPIPSGTYCTRAHRIEGVDILAPASGTIDSDIDKGTPIVIRTQADDAVAQAAIAAIEGGDGIHEHFVSDGDLTYVGAFSRAHAEISTFGSALVRAQWVTHDLQAMPGAQQVINLTSPDALSTTLTIDSVSIDFPIDNTAIASSPSTTCAANRWPRRTCQGSTVKLETILDAIKG